MARARSISAKSRDRGWNELRRLMADIHQGKYTVKVGVMGDDTVEGASLTYPELGVIQEFGTEDGHIPSRPFLRSTFDEQVGAMTEMSRKLMGAIAARKITPVQALNILGGHLAGAIKAKILTGAGVPPPNAESTIRAKARSSSRTRRFFKRAARTFGQALAQAGALASVRPLVETGRLVGAITWAVIRGRPKE